MDAELERRVEALRRPLELAAADGFAGVRRVKGLGHALRAACDALIGKVDGVDAWRVTLAGWEQLDEYHQAIEVARGMRLIARYPRRHAPKVENGKTVADLLPPLPEPPKPKPTRKAKTNEPAKGAEASPSSETTAATAILAKPKPSRTSKKPAATASEPAEASNDEPPPANTEGLEKNVGVPRRLGGETPSPRRGGRTGAVAADQGATGAVDPLAQPTTTLPGIGAAFASRLADKGLVTVEDLLWTLPRRYDDVRGARPLAEIVDSPEGTRATFSAKVASCRMIFARGRRWAEVRLGGIDITNPGNVVVRWFNAWNIDKRLPAGCTVVLSGVVQRRGGRTEFANPDILGVELPNGKVGGELPSVLARYPVIAGVPPSRLRQVCAAACARVGDAVEDGVPAHVETAAQLPPLAEALARLHSPQPDIPVEDLAAMNAGASHWQRRLAFGELFALGIAVALRRRERRADAAVPCAAAAGLDAELTAALPFTLTGAQRRAVGELASELARGVPMNRLLQGDVGAGKTAVAYAAALQVARAGRQTAVMAPTELLAEQHFETWKKWGRLRVELLTASTPKGVRASLLALLAGGQLDVLIGTHSLLSEGVGFLALGLVVIDEQHRFGVAQRAKLRDKGDGQGAPHLLVMTATPIPRTLALTAYGDLDVSILDELPPGRTPIVTHFATGARGRTAAEKLIGERVAAGQRAYVVCPKVEPSDDADDPDAKQWADATTMARELAAAHAQLRVGLVHGRLPTIERDRAMRAFKDGSLDVLVATTVIEVGVDVPAATVMVIHDADRFGLAQLHQLRGRVGRGATASICVLLARNQLSDDAKSRVDTMVETTDGFRIAEQDLLLRGAGDLLGARQAGAPRLRFGNLAQHTELLLEARKHAEAILDEDPDLVRPSNGPLRRALARRLAHDVYGAESG